MSRISTADLLDSMAVREQHAQVELVEVWKSDGIRQGGG